MPTRDVRVTTSFPVPMHHPCTDRVGKNPCPPYSAGQSAPGKNSTQDNLLS
ncbi:MAG TPA: hypothetical protein PKG49_04315 [Nitrosomonas mobilis]|nr:hypothetical protein [Nitrosomonas mobilis]